MVTVYFSAMAWRIVTPLWREFLYRKSCTLWWMCQTLFDCSSAASKNSGRGSRESLPGQCDWNVLRDILFWALVPFLCLLSKMTLRQARAWISCNQLLQVGRSRVTCGDVMTKSFLLRQRFARSRIATVVPKRSAKLLRPCERNISWRSPGNFLIFAFVFGLTIGSMERNMILWDRFCRLYSLI